MTRHVVQAVPNEILDLIFDDCCDTNLFSVAESVYSSLQEIPALTLSTVCSQWRRVALSSSRIWSRISLDLEGDFPPDEDRLSMILTIFISRSRQQPLTLSICAGDSDSLNPEFWGPYEPLAILCREHQRWGSFTFQSDDWTVDHLFRSVGINSPLSPDAFPVLVDLDLPLNDSLSLFTVRAPSLQRLSLHQYSNELWKGSLTPLAHLTHLRLDKIWSLFIQGTISELTGLRSLDVDDDMDIADLVWLYSYGAEASPTACPSIEVLNLCHSEDYNQGHILDSIFPYLSLPSLKTLCLDCGQDFVGRGHLWPNFKPFMMFVKRSSFPLTTLCIKCIGFSDSKLIYLLYHIPTLLNLTVMDPTVKDGEDGIMLTGRFLQSLHVGTGSLLQPTTPLVPRLRCLILNVGGYFFDDKAALDLVESRWAPYGSKYGIDCLRSFTIIFRARMIVPKIYDVLNSFKKDGMKITILCSKSLVSEY